MILCVLNPIIVLTAYGKLAASDVKTQAESSVERESTGSAALDLVGTEWVLVSLRGRALPDGGRITLNIEGDHPYTKFVGDAVCNGYGARNVAIQEGEVEINVVESSAVGCPAIEQTYYEYLQDAVAYRVREGRLEMRNARGENILVYERKRSLPESGGQPASETRQHLQEGRP